MAVPTKNLAPNTKKEALGPPLGPRLGLGWRVGGGWVQISQLASYFGRF